MSKRKTKPAKPKAPPKSKLRDEIDPVRADDSFELSGANRQKRQEYNRTMGHTAELLHDLAANEDSDKRISRYVSTLAEDERRYVNRRRARSVSLAHSRDRLFIRAAEEMISRCLAGKITPRGYATKKSAAPAQRITNVHLSDLHIGARLDPRELGEGFGWTEAARRLAYVTIQAAEYKTQYRDRQSLHIYLNGDLIEGVLGHDQNDGEPLAEQFAAAVAYLGAAIGYLAASYSKVTVWGQTGNHGRNKMRHEGRATNQKWDSYETMIFLALRGMASSLANVEVKISRAPASVVPLFDRAALVTHGDTHVKIGDPDSKGALYEIAMNKINGTLEFGRHIDLALFGHFHKGRMIRLKRSAILINSALVPPNGHAKTEGYDTACGQWLWESVPGRALGDARFVEVGAAQDSDATLDAVIKPFDSSGAL